MTRRRVRLAVQVGMFLLVLGVAATRHAHEVGLTLPFRFPDLHALCPFGAVETAVHLATTGQFVPRTDRSNLWILLGSVLLAVTVGPLFCGWLCPLGSVQDWIGRVGKRIFGRRYNRFVPQRVDRALSYLRYFTLVMIVLQTTRFASLVFASIDPYYALFHIWTGTAATGAVMMLLLVLTGSLVVARPWCRWLCPFGVLQGVLARFSPWTIRQDAARCRDCTLCARACPMGVAVDRDAAVRDTRCNRCLECLEACRVPHTLDFRLPSRATHALSLTAPWVAAVIALVVFFAPVAVARAAGWYVPAGAAGVGAGAVVGSGGAGSGFLAGGNATAFSPEAIRPTMTLAQLAEAAGLEENALLEALRIDPEFDTRTQLFDIEEDDRYAEITVAEVRRRLLDLLGDHNR